MGTVKLTSDRVQVDADIEETAGYDVIDAARPADGDRFLLEVETVDLSFQRRIDAETARNVFDRVTTAESSGAVAAFVEELTEIQTAFFRVLLAADSPVASTALRERMRDRFDVDVSPRALGGSIKGSHAKAKNLFGERVQTTNWLEDTQEYEYYVKEEYVQPLRAELRRDE